MEFDLNSFTLCTSLEVINQCRTKDLIQIADLFNV